jgi:isopentenyl diphosphate isomerase/L-lactate dehydrogenase-like FMN-dependent dehydrogenase
MVIASVSDFRARAKRRMLKFAFDYLDGAAGDEKGAARNVLAFDEVRLLPRMLVNTEKIDLSTTFLGRKWDAPFGTAPVGVGNLLWPRAEETIARATHAANIPYSISTPACTTLEDIRAIAGENAWFQLYVGRAEAMVKGLVSRAEDAGYDVMLVTVDVPVPPRRLRDLYNNFTMPFAWSPWVVWQLLIHPEWSIRTAIAGRPRFANMERYAPMQGVQPLARYMSSNTTGKFDWDELKKLRDRWKGRLVPKGLLTAEDVVKAKEIGCDAVVVSNHGGRQLTSLPSSIEMLPEIRNAVGPKFPLLLDSGVRSGEHIVKALASGADFVLIGRAMMYAAAGLGSKGPKAAIDLLRAEMLQTLGQIGYTDIASLKAAAPVRAPR